MSIPTQFYRGEAIQWESQFEIPTGASALPAVYKVILANEGATISVSSVATSAIQTGDLVTASFAISAADTATLQQGNAMYQVVLTEPGFEKVLESGIIGVLQNLNLMQAGESIEARPSSIIEQTYKAIMQAIRAYAVDGTIAKMVVNGREVQYRSLDELIKIRNEYAQLVRLERGQGNGFARTVRFKAGA